MDWFLYDNGLRHERVNRGMRFVCFSLIFVIDLLYMILKFTQCRLILLKYLQLKFVQIVFVAKLTSFTE